MVDDVLHSCFDVIVLLVLANRTGDIALRLRDLVTKTTKILCFPIAQLRDFFYTLLIPCRKFGPPYLGKATAAARAAIQVLGLFVFP